VSEKSLYGCSGSHHWNPVIKSFYQRLYAARPYPAAGLSGSGLLVLSLTGTFALLIPPPVDLKCKYRATINRNSFVTD
jgi:hypothetical protein